MEKCSIHKSNVKRQIEISHWKSIYKRKHILSFATLKQAILLTVFIDLFLLVDRDSGYTYSPFVSGVVSHLNTASLHDRYNISFSLVCREYLLIYFNPAISFLNKLWDHMMMTGSRKSSVGLTSFLYFLPTSVRSAFLKLWISLGLTQSRLIHRDKFHWPSDN